MIDPSHPKISILMGSINHPQHSPSGLWMFMALAFRTFPSPSSGVSPHLLVNLHGIVRRLGGQWKTSYFMGKSMVKMGLTVKMFPTKTVQRWGLQADYLSCPESLGIIILVLGMEITKNKSETMNFSASYSQFVNKNGLVPS